MKIYKGYQEMKWKNLKNFKNAIGNINKNLKLTIAGVIVCGSTSSGDIDD